jgi:hypothetical protein
MLNPVMSESWLIVSELCRRLEGESIVVEFSPKGEKSFKIKGKPFTQYGVRVWPEVLEVLGYDLDSLEVGKSYPCNERLRVLMEDGKARKVIGAA